MFLIWKLYKYLFSSFYVTPDERWEVGLSIQTNNWDWYGRGAGVGGGVTHHNFLPNLFPCPNYFVRLQEAPKLTLCWLQCQCKLFLFSQDGFYNNLYGLKSYLMSSQLWSRGGGPKHILFLILSFIFTMQNSIFVLPP